MAKKQKGTCNVPLELARTLTEEVNEAWENGSFYEKVSPITQDLLRYWFFPAFSDIRDINFHEGQKQAILNIIYYFSILLNFTHYNFAYINCLFYHFLYFVHQKD